MNAPKLWQILKTQDIKPAKGSLFYGSGALVKKADQGWRVIPCGASFFDVERCVRDARETIRTALTSHNVEFTEKNGEFHIN